jgi:hypothetical protein
MAADHPNDDNVHWALGAVYARLGDRRGVQRMDRWLVRTNARSKSVVLGWSVNYERARLAAILGERERAMALLHQAVKEGGFPDGGHDGQGHGLGPHSDPDFESLRDYPPFQKLMRPED